MGLSARSRPLRRQVAALQRPRDLAVAAAGATSAKKAADVVVLDLAGLTEAADYFVIASGASDTQVRAIAENVIEEVERGEGGAPWHVEGLAAGRWVLLDYIDVVVHVFHHEMREYYQLERLWGDAARVDWTQ